MANSKVNARRESLILRELTLILSREFQNPILNSISISEVKLTQNQELAKIYYSFVTFSNSNITKEKVEEELNLNAKKIRKLLAAKIQMRIVPELQFIYDISLDNANKIEKILNDLKSK